MWFSKITFLGIFLRFLAISIIVFLVFPLIDFVRAFMAYKLGDPTAKNMGRMTLNPFVHIDLLGAISMFLIGIGWSKYLPVNSLNFKNPKRDTALVALASPFANLLSALLGGFILSAIFAVKGNLTPAWIHIFFLYYIEINVFLMLIHLLPLPGMNGEVFLDLLLPEKFLIKYYRFYSKFGVYAPILVLILLFTILSGPLSMLSNLICEFIIRVTGLAFGLQIP